MFVSEKNNFQKNVCKNKQKRMENKFSLQNPLNFESFFLNQNAKKILEEIDKKSRYLRRRSNIESTIVSDTEYSKVDSSTEQYNHKFYNRNIFNEENDYENIKNKSEIDSKSNITSKKLNNSVHINKSNEHNIEITRDVKLSNQEEIQYEDKYINNIIYSNIEKSENISEINQDYCNDNLEKDESIIVPKKLNLFKKIDVKMCVWIFLSYAFLDTFVAVYYACTPLQMAFIAMLMGSLLFYKYT
uniref:Transmembrane protein n=1 Tax=Strongyloides stercoralis TaxID=6248 RepID=A0A0K0E8M9_STRER